MFRLGGDLQGYLHPEPVDFRAGINSLAVLVQETMTLDPFAPAVFAFCNRRCDRIKLLFFDRSGFVLVLKRLTEDKFRWPRRHEAVVTLTTEQLHWILDGIDIDAMVRHPVRQYQIAGCRVSTFAVDAAKRFRFKTTMTRTGGPDVAELMAQLAANAAEIAALKADKEALSARV